MSRINTVAQPRDDNEINLTPMLDVVFIMLIFFIVTASFIRETGVSARTTDSSVASDKEPAVILVSIDADDEYWIEHRHIDRQSLQANLAGLSAINPEYSVVIQPDRDSTAQALVTAIDAANAARIINVAIAETPADFEEPTR